MKRTLTDNNELLPLVEVLKFGTADIVVAAAAATVVIVETGVAAAPLDVGIFPHHDICPDKTAVLTNNC